MKMVIFVVLAVAAFCSKACACEADVEAVSARFLGLRDTRGHFDGGPWNQAVDQWGGERHRLMQCLAARATGAYVDAPQLLRWMGIPDARKRCPSRACNEFRRSDGRASEVWVYRWRGEHDRLGLVMRGGRVRQAVWVYAGE